jgi:chromosome segregation ATPase
MIARNPILVALLHPVNLAMLALVVAAGLCAAWWLFPIGLLLWGYMVVSVARHPSLRISHAMDSRTTLAPRFQSRFDRLQRVQVNIYNVLAAGDAAVQRALRPLEEEVNQLVDQAYRLGQRVSALENYRVVSQSKEDLEVEWARLSQQAETATDPHIKSEYDQSAAEFEKRLNRQRQTTAYLDRVEAQFTSLAGALDGVLAEILRLQALGLGEVKRNRAALIQTIRREKQELAAFEREEAAAMDPVAVPIPPPG